MEASARVAKLILVRRNSRKDLTSLGTLFSQWSNARSASDPMRRMTMGGAPPPVEAPEPAIDACMDAFCAVQLTSPKQDSLLMSSPRGSFKNLASLLLSPATSLKDGTTLLSPRSNADVIPRISFGASGDSNEAPPLESTGSPTIAMPCAGGVQVC
ncbi:hypothetical protein Vretimale_4861 [Volvox reticuliferus]|uniref:Uncharacterized protein n=1 Tax=Volvox reticuliferus TaxID=1737510 RepID=A0A8J4C256_9CHLO|nr:hypothetical protein Vretifemale_3486 [Volvox reticuliferus]GIL99720.1 hypothetical protein Vretimale_4861 [Volvox reticuliferus]